MARFNALWQAHAGRVLAYATRHVGADAAQEVVSETFLVAWRRLADVPGDELPWLLVVARNTITNHRRSTHRRALLHGELARLQQAAGPADAAEVTVTDRSQVLSALARMSAKEREALLLVTWDGLSAADAARVAGCSVSALHVRLFRARRRLREATDEGAAHSHREHAHPTGAPTSAPLPLPRPARPLDAAPRSPR